MHWSFFGVYNSAMDKEVEKIKTWLGTGSINIFGWPFSGKDTQGRKLAELFNASLIGGGEILRNAKNIPSYVKEAIDKGNLAPTDEYVQIIVPYLSRPEYTNKPIIMSSLGRWHGEEKAIIKAARDTGHHMKAVVYLHLDEEEASARAKKSKLAADRGQRTDDAEEYLQTRYSEFRNKTLPVIDFYRDMGILVEINGKQTPEKVTREILNRLAAFIK